ncbi:MAG: flagellar hook-length control protein FliK [Deltaproteobacteria bacterium]|nr:flagellar hook-length control protein FliK [Deltaproteobacteria bacterium]
MNLFSIGNDVSALVGKLSSVKLNRDTVESGFEALLATMTQRLDAPVATTQQTSNATSVAVEAVTTDQKLVSPANTPLAKLEKSLYATDRSLDDLMLPPEARSKLEKVLTASGYSAEDARNILDRASDQDGNINLGKLFRAVPDFAPVEGPVFFLPVEDEPLLIQALKDLGVQDTDIRKWLAGLAEKDGQLEVKGLPQLLAKSASGSVEVDKGLLRELLGKIGLNAKEVNNLLTQGTDTQGRTNPQTFLAMLQVAAERQNQEVAAALKELAGQVRTQKATASGEHDDARALRVQVETALAKGNKALEQGEKVMDYTPDKPATAKTAAAAAAEALDKLADPGKGVFKAVVKEETEAALTGEAGKAAKSAETASARPASQTGATASAAAANAAAAQTPRAEAAVATAAAAEAGPGKSATGAAVAEAAQEVKASGEPRRVEAGSGAEGRSQAGSLNLSNSPASQVSAGRPNLPVYVVRQVGQQIASMVQKNQTNLKLALKPAGLGGVDVSLSLKDGVLKATLTAETVAAKHALESGLDQLKTQLSQAGLKVDRLEVILDPDAQNRDAQAQAQAQTDQRGRRGSFGFAADGSLSGGDVGDESVTAATTGSSLSGRISLFA